MSAQGSWLSTKQISSCLSGTENKATSLCYRVNPQHTHFDVLPAPVSQKGQSTMEQFWRTAVRSEKSCCTRTGQIVQSTSAQKGAHEGESQQAVSLSLLWVMEMGSVVLHLPNQGLVGLIQNQQIQGGEQSGSLPHTLLSFGFSGHRVRQVPKA